MNTFIANPNSLAGTLREPGHVYLSPQRLSAMLGLDIQGVAERARVNHNTPEARPQDESLQRYMRDVVRVLVAAESVTIGDRDRAIFWFMNESLKDFNYQTPDRLVGMGKAQVVIEYIESIVGGATG